MMTDEELVAEMRAGLKGVTPGPWTYLKPELDDKIEGTYCYPGGIEGDDGNPVCEFGSPAGSATMFENTADHHHIARCSPDNIARLLDAIERLTRERDAARAAALEEAARVADAFDDGTHPLWKVGVLNYRPPYDDLEPTDSDMLERLPRAIRDLASKGGE